MHWPTKPLSTAKLSHVGREAILRNASDVIRRLEEIRTRAVQHSTSESITALAARIPLPPSSDAEQVDLWDAPDGVACSRMEAISPQEALGWKPWDGSEELRGEAAPGSSSEVVVREDTHTLLSPWTESLPGMLETYLCLLDNVSQSPRSTPAYSDPVAAADPKPPFAVVDDAGSFISTECLVKLQNSINESYRRREIMKEGLQMARRASRCKTCR